ncbi:hypothetical protein [Ohtaekwangia koreensis]|uniref:Uncharacterized protein n=1 Tax=Ohtaekwangia koreensis TaxID=688867 RepID=A0A1T5LIK0_9BACT|nr:hypothetical protein [Ohtaekwangia koreensis]SKC75810.1 hypothetical protein SAMN05660236_3305 [Ohtaekwangia koreensis]
MKYIDTIAQTLFIAAALVFLFLGIFYHDVRGFIFVCQFFLGCWQVASCIISLIKHPENNSSRRKHLLISVFYILSLFVFGAAISHYKIPNVYTLIYGTVPAWALGIYYYIITLRWCFPKIKRSGFLPHLSF